MKNSLSAGDECRGGSGGLIERSQRFDFRDGARGALQVAEDGARTAHRKIQPQGRRPIRSHRRTLVKRKAMLQPARIVLPPLLHDSAAFGVKVKPDFFPWD